MQVRVIVFVALSCIFLFSNVYAQKREGTLAECQYLKDQIDYYARLRKKGGLIDDMEEWKRLLTRYRARYDDYQCDRWRNQLR